MRQTCHDLAGRQRPSAREFESYNLRLESFSATYAGPMVSFEIEELESQGDNNFRAPFSKLRAVALRLLASQQVSRIAGGCMERDSTNISLAGFCIALVVIKRATMYSAVEKFWLASRSVLLHEAPTGLSSERRR